MMRDEESSGAVLTGAQGIGLAYDFLHSCLVKLLLCLVRVYLLFLDAEQYIHV